MSTPVDPHWQACGELEGRLRSTVHSFLQEQPDIPGEFVLATVTLFAARANKTSALREEYLRMVASAWDHGGHPLVGGGAGP